MNDKKKIVLINFRTDEDLNKLIDEYAEKTRQPKSRFIREAILKEISRIIDEERKEQ